MAQQLRKSIQIQEILFTDGLEGSPSDITYDGVNIWVGGSTLHKVNPTSNTVDVVSTEAVNLIFDGEHIWGITEWLGQELVKINPVTGSVLSTINIGQDTHTALLLMEFIFGFHNL